MIGAKSFQKRNMREREREGGREGEREREREREQARSFGAGGEKNDTRKKLLYVIVNGSKME